MREGVRIVTGAELPGLLPMADCIEAMAEAFRTLASGGAENPLRSMVWLPGRRGLLGLMPAYLESPSAIGLKVVTVMPGNHGTEDDSHQGAVLVFETGRGRLRAIVDASTLTAIRTAAVSGLATRMLARADASTLAVLGSGVQATSHLEAMATVRRLSGVRVWSRDPAHARAFAEREGRRLGLEVEARPSAREAVEGADLVCTTTSAKTPVLEGAWLAAGAHVNAVGACFPDARELDTAAVARARLFVDRRESTLQEAGDFLMPLREGAIAESHIVGEIGDLVTGRLEGRRSGTEITLFKSLGLAIEDLAAADRVWRNAVARGAGTTLELGGRRSVPHGG